ncbi:hypothetical protein ACFVUN_36260 [Kitasatospora griseola]|uniref:hypothetical protein n=1 Tax=Kitasatospora griseola TaxID=2064 RepID=UPI0036DBE39B
MAEKLLPRYLAAHLRPPIQPGTTEVEHGPGEPAPGRTEHDGPAGTSPLGRSRRHARAPGPSEEGRTPPGRTEHDPDFNGPLLHSLGDRLDLYERALRVGTGTTHPLLGLTIDDQYSPTEAYIYLTPPDGRRELLTLALENTPEADVRAFVVHVHNAIADAGAANQRIRALIPKAKAELERVTADTGDRLQAEQKAQQVTAQLNLRVLQARREVDAACGRWQQLTGERPG